MATRTRRIWIGAALALACAHAPQKPAAPVKPVTWPEGAAPRLRLVALVPSPDAPPPRRPWWRRVARAIVGTSPEERSALRLVRPFGVAVAADGTLYVADPDAPGVFRFEPGGEIAPVSCRSREWGSPMAVTVGSDGRLWVADAGAAEIVAVSPDRRCRALGAGELARPTGVALSGGRIVVADPPRHQLAVFSEDGALVERWGTEGSGDGQLHFPTALATEEAGVLVVDALNFRIVRTRLDRSTASSFGAPGSDGGGFARPKGVATDAAGRIYVSDAQRDVVLVYGAGGEFEYAAGATGTAPGTFQHPAGVAVQRDRLYVADSQNGRVQVFEILGGS